MKSVAAKALRILFFVLTVFVAGGGVYLGLLWRGDGSPPPEEPAPAAPVKWMEARQFFVEEWTEVVGSTQPLPDRAARITSPIEGRVVSVLQGADGSSLVEGQVVKKGDIIVQLDSVLAKANRDKAEAAEEELRQLTKQAAVAVKLAEIDVVRLTELTKHSSIDERLVLVSSIDMAKARLVLLDAESKQKAAESREITAKKEIEGLNKLLQLSSLTAPIDGRLGRLLVVQGQTLPSGTLVADIVNIDEKIDVLCFVPPHVARRLKKGQPARIGAVGEPQRGAAALVEGKLEFIANQAEVDTGNIAVKIRFPNSKLGLGSNLTLRLRVLTTPGKACLTLPTSALFEDQDPPTVIVVEDYKVVKTPDGKEVEMGKARRLRAKLGIRDRVLNLVEVVGLEDPENKWKGSLDDVKFVVERGQGLRNGDAIRLEVEED
jgi:RND family efflux transporter MFP subunit